MPKITFDQPSTGAVSDPAPALTISNDTGPCLILSESAALPTIPPGFSVPLIGLGDKLTSAFLWNHTGEAVVALSAEAGAVAASGATGGAALLSVNQASGSGTPSGGYAVQGINARFAGTGAAGIAMGARGVGVVGAGLEDGIGILGLGYHEGVRGVSKQSSGVVGVAAAGNAPGVLGDHAGAGPGVRGHSVAGPAVEALGIAGAGVVASSEQAEAVRAEASNVAAPSIIAIHGAGTAISATCQTGTGIDVFGMSGTGVNIENANGQALSIHVTKGTGPAVSIHSDLSSALYVHTATGDYAVNGFSGDGAGVFGVSGGTPDPTDPSKTAGVAGVSWEGAAVVGRTLTGTGVFGSSAPGMGWAAQFQGDVNVIGAIYKTVSYFSIDHPLDPERKRLNHAAVEAPELKTLQDGVVTLDAEGQARVAMPAWFDALNEELRYQLTPIGSPAPELHVAEEFDAGRFAIAGGRPHQKVCWQVTGRRRDAWARANPLSVEQLKSSLPNLSPASPLEPYLQRLQQQVAELREEAGRNTERSSNRDRGRRAPAPLPDAGNAGDLEAHRRSAREALKRIEDLAAMLPQTAGRQKA
jgi:hypothetical protein